MSKLILNQLKAIAPLVKSKGADFEVYGFIHNYTLYFFNGVVNVELKVDIPFDCVVNLHELVTILSALKAESVIVNNEGKIYVESENNRYSVNTIPAMGFIEQLAQYNWDLRYKVEKADIFPAMMKLAETYVQPPQFEGTYDIHERLQIDKGQVYVTDRNNLFQAILDYGMPDLALDRNAISCFNRLYKKCEIVALDYKDSILAVELSNGIKIYMQDVLSYCPVKNLGQKVEGVFNQHWNTDGLFELPNYVAEQAKVLEKLTVSKVLFFNNHFCQTDQHQVQYPHIDCEPFAVKALYKHCKVLFDNASKISVNDKALCFVNDNNTLRGIIGIIQQD